MIKNSVKLLYQQVYLQLQHLLGSRFEETGDEDYKKMIKDVGKTYKQTMAKINN